MLHSSRAMQTYPDPESLLDDPLSDGEKADQKLYDILEVDALIQDKKMHWIGGQSWAVALSPPSRSPNP
jgi:hypothetical protein